MIEALTFYGYFLGIFPLCFCELPDIYRYMYTKCFVEELELLSYIILYRLEGSVLVP